MAKYDPKHQPYELKGGNWTSSQWYSDERAAKAPRLWSPLGAPETHLAYITKEEVVLLQEQAKKKGVELVSFKGPAGVPLLVPKKATVELGKPGGEEAKNVPREWKSSPDHPLAVLHYVTTEQAEFLKKSDIHGSGVDKHNHYGPQNVPSYQGDGGGGDGGGDGGSGSGDSSGGGFGNGDGDTGGFGNGGYDAGNAGGYGDGSVGGGWGGWDSETDTDAAASAAATAAAAAAAAAADIDGVGFNAAKDSQQANDSLGLSHSVDTNNYDGVSLSNVNTGLSLSDLVSLAVQLGIPGPIGWAVSMAINSIATGKAPSLGSIAGFVGNALAGPMAGQIAAAGVNAAQSGKAPGLGAIGGIAAAGLGINSSLGSMLGNMMDGKSPTAAGIGGVLGGLAAPGLGVPGGFASSLGSMLGGLVAGQTATSGMSDNGFSTNADGSMYGGDFSSWAGDSPSAAPKGSSSGVTGGQNLVNPGNPGTSLLPGFYGGGFTLDEGGSGFGVVVPESFFENNTGVTQTPGPGVRVVNSSIGDNTGFGQDEGDISTTMARVYGGRRPGF